VKRSVNRSFAGSHITDDERARELWEQGTKRLSDGQVEEAVELFERSIAVKPTAEGHISRMGALEPGHLDEATEECKQAIELDPDFGKPTIGPLS
jgi:tetratricopeptide (TPR) repeat protein